jgi:hypothetical protein
VTDEFKKEETNEERDERFRELNDRIWGIDNWIRCSVCSHDSNNREIYHHKNMHRR